MSVAPIAPTVSVVPAASLEMMIRFNEGMGVNCLSEEGLEAPHKYVGRYRVENIRDVFGQLLCQSNYVEFVKRSH